MDLEFTTFVRKPFTVQAVRITESNIEEVAEFVGEVRYLDEAQKKPYIHVNRRLVPYVLKVFPGFWMTRLGDEIRCYANKVFHEQFIESDNHVVEAVGMINGDVVPDIKLGAFGRILDSHG